MTRLNWDRARSRYGGELPDEPSDAEMLEWAVALLQAVGYTGPIPSQPADAFVLASRIEAERELEDRRTEDLADAETARRAAARGARKAEVAAAIEFGRTARALKRLLNDRSDSELRRHAAETLDQELDDNLDLIDSSGLDEVDADELRDAIEAAASRLGRAL